MRERVVGKSGLLAASAAMAFVTSGATEAARPLPKASIVLWNQNSNFGGGVNSQIYESSMSAYNDFAADDFVVPAGQTWTVTEVDVTGAYVGGTGPAPSVEIWIYWNKAGRPDAGRKGLGKYNATVSCTDNGGSFQCQLPGKHHKPGAKLPAGTYWISVAAVCASSVCGEWKWTENTTVTGYQAGWFNPGNGWGTNCTGFEDLTTCFGGSPADLAFELIGSR